MDDMVYLGQAAVAGLDIPMAEVLAAVENGFRLKGLGRTEMPPKPGIHPQPDAFLHAMPAYVQEVEAAGLKWVAGFPANVAKGLPYISGLLILNDPKTGLPLAVMDCTWITAMRTGASVGVAARHLAKSGSYTAGFLGCGVQARTSLMALVEVLPELREIRCCDLFPAATTRFIAEMSALFPALSFTPCEGVTDLMSGVDVVVSAIPIVKDPTPPLDLSHMVPGLLAVSLDYDAAWTGRAMQAFDRFVSDDVGQLLATRAHGPYFAGIPEVIDADLGELATGQKSGRSTAQQTIFAMNMGIAVDDMVTARLVLDRAIERGAGIRLPL